MSISEATSCAKHLMMFVLGFPVNSVKNFEDIHVGIEHIVLEYHTDFSVLGRDKDTLIVRIQAGIAGIDLTLIVEGRYVNQLPDHIGDP